MTKQNRQLLLVVSSGIIMGTFVWLLMSIVESKILNPHTFITVLTSSIVSSLSTVIIKDLDLIF